jgi:hypothetical protein
VRYRVPLRLAHATLSTGGAGVEESELRVYVRPLPGGPTLGLAGVSALIWSLAVEGPADVVAAVCEVVGESPETIRCDIERHLRILVERGLLDIAEWD